MKVAPIFFVLSSVLYANILFLINDLVTDPSCDQPNISSRVIQSLVLIIVIRILDKRENFKFNLSYGYFK
jgi:hypothetical protein